MGKWSLLLGALKCYVASLIFVRLFVSLRCILKISTIILILYGSLTLPPGLFSEKSGTEKDSAATFLKTFIHHLFIVNVCIIIVRSLYNIEGEITMVTACWSLMVIFRLLRSIFSSGSSHLVLEQWGFIFWSWVMKPMAFIIVVQNKNFPRVLNELY